MVFLITDAEESKLLPCPAAIRIGRGTDNNIRPESQSVSKHHAIIHTNFIADTTKVEVKIEDLQSRNGTFMGPSPLEMEKVNGTKLVLPGSYIRFGHSQKYFRLVDRIDGNEDEILRVSGTSPNIHMKVLMSPGQNHFGSSGGALAGTAVAGTVSPMKQQPFRYRSESPLLPGGGQNTSVDNNHAGSPSNMNVLQPVSDLISDRAEHPTSTISFQPFDRNKHQTLTNYANYIQSFHNQLSVIFQQATQSSTNEFNQATNITTGKTLKDFFEKEYEVDKIESEIGKIRKLLIANKDTILILFLSMNTLEVDINTILQILDLTLSIISTFAMRFVNNNGVIADDNDTHVHEVNGAVLRETQDMLCNMLAVFNQSRKNSLVEQVEKLLVHHFKSTKFSAQSSNENMDMLRDAVARCSTASLVSNQKFYDMSKVIVSSLCPFVLIASIEYITLLNVNEMCNEELQSSANRKAKGSNATLLKIRQIASMRDSSLVKASIDDFRKEEMELMGKRHGRLSRVFRFLIKSYLKIHFGKWKAIIVERREKLMTLWDALIQYSHRIKRDAFKKWLCKSGFLLKVKRALERLYRQVHHGAFKSVSRYFHKWVRAIQTTKKKSAARGMEEQLDYLLLKSQIEQLRNGDSIAAKLIAEKTLNRELLTTNVHLREVLHKSIVSENHHLGAKVTATDIYSENSTLKSQLELLREELNKIKEYLNSSNPKSSKATYRTNPVALPINNASGGNVDKRLMALKLLEFEVKSSRSRLEKSMATNEFLNNEVAKEKLRNAELSTANQELAARLSKMEATGSSLRNILLARYGEQEVLQILADLDRRCGIDQWLLSSFSEK